MNEIEIMKACPYCGRGIALDRGVENAVGTGL